MRKTVPFLLVAAGLQLSAFGQSPVSPAKSPAPAEATPPLKTYQGEYRGGQATYTYYLDQHGKRVRHGTFTSVRREEGDVLIIALRVISQAYTEHKETGSYAHGQKQGRWTTTTTEYSLPGNRKSMLVTDINRQQISTVMYVGGKPVGAVSYADKPWKAGKPLAATTSASATRQMLAQQVTMVTPAPNLFDRDSPDLDELEANPALGEASERDTTVLAEEYAAGPFRYTGPASDSDPAHRPETVRGFFDKAGYCDSTWQLTYWKTGSERDDAAPSEQAGGWSTTTLRFSHGTLLEETTEQMSTGEAFGSEPLNLAVLDSCSRLERILQPVHLYSKEVRDDGHRAPEWNTALSEEIVGLLRTATWPLGAPRLANTYYRVAPTALDSAVLGQAETVLREAELQWRDSVLTGQQVRRVPSAVPANPSLAYLRTDLYRLLAAEETDRPEDSSTAPLILYLRDWQAQRRSRSEDPTPWLRRLQEVQPLTTLEAAQKRQQQYVTHLNRIRQRTQQLQARLVTLSGKS